MQKGAENKTGYRRQLQFFPRPVLKILPAGLTASLVLSVGLSVLNGCHTTTTSVEASTTRNPVVAPAGTVLRVRLNQTLESGRSRPGDRFSGVLDTAVMSGSLAPTKRCRRTKPQPMAPAIPARMPKPTGVKVCRKIKWRTLCMEQLEWGQRVFGRGEESNVWRFLKS